LDASNNRIFDAYVNIGSLIKEVPTIIERYPRAKFIITKKESEILDDEDLKIIDFLSGLDVAFLHLDTANKWQVVCEHLRCAPPVCSFPELPDEGQRELFSKTIEGDSVLRCVPAKRDVSPWVVEQNNWWSGIHAISEKRESSIEKNLVNFSDSLKYIDKKRWFMREDTFTDNMALFRPSNIELHAELGAAFTVKRESLG